MTSEERLMLDSYERQGDRQPGNGSRAKAALLPLKRVQSMVSSQPSFTKEKPKQKIPLADTRKGKILDTAAAFIGLPHICSNE